MRPVPSRPLDRLMPMLRARRGSAIILVMLTTVALAALALSAIFMSSSSVLMTKYYDKERDFRYAAEQALQLGMSQNATGHRDASPRQRLRDADVERAAHGRLQQPAPDGSGESVRGPERHEHGAVWCIREHRGAGAGLTGQHALRATPRAHGGQLRPVRDVHQQFPKRHLLRERRVH